MRSDGERVPVIVPWILLAGLGAAILVTNLMQRSRFESDFPAEIDGLQVVGVFRSGLRRVGSPVSGQASGAS